MKLVFLVLFVGISTASCSNKELYNYSQKENKKSCQKGPASQYEECIKNNSISHKEYEKERKKLIN